MAGCVKHGYGEMAMSIGIEKTGRVGLERTEAWWGLKNETANNDMAASGKHPGHLVIEPEVEIEISSLATSLAVFVISANTEEV